MTGVKMDTEDMRFITDQISGVRQEVKDGLAALPCREHDKLFAAMRQQQKSSAGGWKKIHTILIGFSVVIALASLATAMVVAFVK